MAELGEYIVSLTSAALLCSIILSLLKDGSAKGIVRLACGVFLTITAFSPMVDIQLPSLEDLFAAYHADSELAASYGEDMVMEARKEIIKEKVEAYLLDKAKGMGLSIQAEVLLDEEDIPCSVHIWPEPDIRNKEQLTQIITTDLGISKENLQWSG